MPNYRGLDKETLTAKIKDLRKRVREEREPSFTLNVNWRFYFYYIFVIFRKDFL